MSHNLVRFAGEIGFRSLTALICTIALGACKTAPEPDTVCPIGAQWCDCTMAGTCDLGLSCVAGTSASGKNQVCKATAGDNPSGNSNVPQLPGNQSAAPQVPQGSRLGGLYSAYSDTRNVYFLLDDDGRFFSSKPKWRDDGTFDLKASAEAWPAQAGSYRRMQNALVLVWADKERTVPLKYSGSGEPTFDYNGVTYRPVHFSTVKLLSGSFLSRYLVMSGDPSMPGTTIGSDVKIDFSLDGRFSMDKTVVANFRAGHRFITGSSSSSDGTGTYQIQGSLLKLRFGDGAVVEDIFAPILTTSGSRNPNDDGFDLGFNIYLRR